MTRGRFTRDELTDLAHLSLRQAAEHAERASRPGTYVSPADHEAHLSQTWTALSRQAVYLRSTLPAEPAPPPTERTFTPHPPASQTTMRVPAPGAGP